MIKVHCFTNLDLYNEEFPEYFPVVPRVGERVESITEQGGTRLTLEVYSVTYRKIKNRMHPKPNGEVIPLVELHLIKSIWGNKNLYDFYDWYSKRVGKSRSYFI